MKNICFISNYKKTYFFDAIGKQILDSGGNVYWIVLNQKLFDFLEPIYGAERLLLINKNAEKEVSDKVGEYKLNELVSVDRALKYYGEWSYRYLKHIQRPIYDFIKSNNISFIFGETTYAHEVMIHRIVNDKTELNCKYLHPQTIRIPAYHFTFLEDEFQSKIYQEVKFDTYKEGTLIEIQKPTESVIVEKMVSKSMSPLSKVLRAKRFFTQENMELDDPSISPTNLSGRFDKGVSEESNRLTYPLIQTSSYDDIKGKKFVVYTLHKQPEASVDIVGRYYDDQLVNVRNIWRILPDDWYLVVKEHTNAIGDRSVVFFRKIKNLRNVILANEKINSHQLILDSQAVFSVSGSIAYEAGLLNKPAFIFVSMFFDRLEGINHITLETLRKTGNIHELLALSESNKDKKMDVKQFSRYLLSLSSKGLISDPVTDIKCMSEENIQNVSNAFLRIIE